MSDARTPSRRSTISTRRVYHGSCFCDAVQITQGAENIRTYSKMPLSYRKWCTTGGGHIFTEHPTWGLTNVYVAVIPDLPYQAGLHVNHEETKLRIQDGLPKLKDLPKEMGGSGITVSE